MLKSIALIPEMDLVRTDEDCFKIDVGFFSGERVGDDYFRISWLFLPMSTGTGFISTFEFLRVGLCTLSAYFCCFWTGDWLPLGPQLSNLEFVMI